MYKSNKLLIILSIILLYIFIETPCIAVASTSYVWSPQNQTIPTSSTIKLNTEDQEDNFLNLESESAILVEQTTGKILYSHNIHEQLRPASVTKVMSILLIMKQLKSGKLQLTDQIPCSEKAASMGGSQIWLDTTETLTADEMLKAICVRKCK